jgi:hypothetical protein
MKTKARKRAQNTDQSTGNRCRYRTPTGRRCRAARSSPSSPHCAHHRAMAKKAPLDDIAADLTARLKDIRVSLQSAQGVHNSLAELYVLLAQDRVSPRRAAVLAYLSSLLLRTLPDSGEDAAALKPEIKFVFNRAPKPEVEAAGPLTDESQLTEHWPGAVYEVRTQYGPRPEKQDVAISESEAIANFGAIST